MAAESRGSVAPLNQVLFDEPYRFGFFQAVRLLERLSPERALVGRHDTSPREEVVRFRSRPTLQFPASEIHQLSHQAHGSQEEDAPPEMMVSFMGLIGPLGVLPGYTTELVAERVRYKDTALWEFLDLFNHRMVSLFYRAWERYRFAVTFERGVHDEFTDYLFNLIGLGTRGQQGRLEVPDHGLLLYGGLILQRPHSASAMEAMLGDYFNAPARLKPFTGQWLELDEESLCRLGRANSELGINTVAGARVWDTQSKFRLCFGPLTLRQFTAFLPVGTNFQPAMHLTRFVAGAELDFDIQLVLKAAEVPACALAGAASEATNRPLLGWTTWLKTRPFSQDDAQVILSVNH